MRRQLVRSTFAAVVLSVLIMGVPLGIGGWWLAADDFRRLRGWLDAQSPQQLPPLLVVGVLVALSVVAVLAGVFVASLTARRFAEPMIQLVDRAERLGAGESQFQPLVTGIQEVDRVSEVLSRSAHQMTRSLASERGFASAASTSGGGGPGGTGGGCCPCWCVRRIADRPQVCRADDPAGGPS
ncbi:MAG: hypothetical protein QOF35_806 [Actinomycetota bacterium]|nr:hypothetical protein [Actinomycetota bacterium]